METINNIADAIARSASHNEIVRVEVRSLTTAIQGCDAVANVEDYVHTEDMHTEARMVDIWGKTFAGDEFRLYLVADLSEDEE